MGDRPVLRVVGLSCVFVLGLAQARPAFAGAGARSLSLADRVAAQRAIEQVQWRHRIWPADSRGPRPALDRLLPASALRERVADYLAKSAALEKWWGRRVTPTQLTAELRRMTRETRDPERLREMFAALGDDPALAAECLARPALVERLVRSAWAQDRRFQAEAQARAQRALRSHPAPEDLRRLDGGFRELSWTMTDSTTSPSPVAGDPTPVSAAEWERRIAEWAAAFGVPTVAQPGVPLSADELLARLPVRQVSPLQEDETSFYVVAVMERAPRRLRAVLVSWPKRAFEDWWVDAKGDFSAEELAAVGATPESFGALPEIAGPGCTLDVWTGLDPGVPDPGARTAVWTGSELIVWGGRLNDPRQTGFRYNPATDTWTPTSIIGAPAPRSEHTVVWTGREMIIWGGRSSATTYLVTGGRYDPALDIWTPTTTTGAPYARHWHTAVWTGARMIVWGGYGGGNTGGLYDPTADAWAPMTTAGAPAGRYWHTAVWTGSRMIVWGGVGGAYLQTGGRYDPAADVWTPTSVAYAPSGRAYHTAVWTGSRMIVWGGENFDGSMPVGLNDGSRYDPATDSWNAVNRTNAPEGRRQHTAVWTGSEMVVWGGDVQQSSTPGRRFNSGGRYNPATDEWTPTSTGVNAPAARTEHVAVWADKEMIVWGGAADYELISGGRYDPAANSWIATHSATSAPEARAYHTAVWTGAEMIVWGGQGLAGALNSGSRYDPATAVWTTVTQVAAPARRMAHRAVWTGTEMLVWGGNDGSRRPAAGGRYDPAGTVWRSMTVGPGSRVGHTAVWARGEMIVWGGQDDAFANCDTGWRYNPSRDVWRPTSTAGAPIARRNHTAVWTGAEMIVWGGRSDAGGLNSGGRYDPQTDSWVATSQLDAPATVREGHTAIWTGHEMIIWGWGFG